MIFERTVVGTPYRVALSDGTVTGTELDVAHVFLTGEVGLICHTLDGQI